MWTSHEMELIDQMIARELDHARSTGVDRYRLLDLERVEILQKIRMLSGSETASIAMARAAERFWGKRAEDLEREAEEAKQHHGHTRTVRRSA